MKPILKYHIFAIIITGCLISQTAFAKSLINIHVSIMPQKYFVERIGRTHVRVDVLVTPGKNPATYSPSPDQIERLAASDIYFRIGVPFENGFLHKIKSISKAVIVDTRTGIVIRKMRENHSHGNIQNKSLGNDPHIWMNPLMVKKQAHTIFTTLSHIDPDHQEEYKNNYNQFAKDLDALDHYLKTMLENLKGEHLFVFHPSFGYFTDAYGLKQVAIETMGKAPKGKALSHIIKLAKKQKAKVIFAQPQFDRNTAEKIASAINGRVVFIDPLAYHYITNMKDIADAITGGLKK